jgi:hypothetical protein
MVAPCAAARSNNTVSTLAMSAANWHHRARLALSPSRGRDLFGKEVDAGEVAQWLTD